MAFVLPSACPSSGVVLSRRHDVQACYASLPSSCSSSSSSPPSFATRTTTQSTRCTIITNGRPSFFIPAPFSLSSSSSSSFFISSSIPHHLTPLQSSCHRTTPLHFSPTPVPCPSPLTSTTMTTGAPLGGKGKKPSRNRRTRNAKQSSSAPSGPSSGKKKLDPETVFLETPPSRYELIVPTLSILTVIGIFPFVGAVARALWVRYKITSRRISIASGFQGKDTTEIIYRDIACIKYVRRLGDAADCVITLKDGAKLEVRAIPEFGKVFEYIMERLDETARDESGPA